MMFLASLVNHAIAGVVPKMNVIEFHNDILVLGYRLLKLKPLGIPPRTCQLQNGTHLGLTAFLMTFLQGWDGRVASNALLSKLLLAEAHRSRSMARDNQEMLLWLLHIGAASCGLWEDPLWVTITKHTLHELGIQSWENVKVILAQFPWVDAVHDSSGRTLWRVCNEVRSGKTTESASILWYPMRVRKRREETK